MKRKMNDGSFNMMLEKMALGLQPIIEQKANDAMRTAGMGRIERKHGIFPGVKNSAPAKERAYRFFSAMIGGDVIGAKALSEGTSSAGGYLVPADFRSEIIARLPEQSELAPYVQVVPVRTESGSIPSLSSDIAITWRGGATSPAENQSFGESQPVLGAVNWSLKRADAITKISRELVADSQPSVIEFITRLFQDAISRERDRMIAVGSAGGVTAGTQPVGIENTTFTNTVAIDDALTYAALVELEHTLARKYRNNARWIMNSANLHRIFALADTTGRPLFSREVVGEKPQTYILGYPVSVQDDLADDNIFFGDLSCYIWFDREEMGIESTNAGGSAFENHQTWIKVWERVDGKVGLEEAFVKGSGITG